MRWNVRCARNPELVAQAAQYRDLRTRLESAYAPELAEPVPERLLAVLRTPMRAPVADLREVRGRPRRPLG
jgi:anti-sigma factor RsiW